MSKVYSYYSGSGKYIGFGLRIETGTERTTIIVDIFNIIQTVRDTTDVHLKGYSYYSRRRAEKQ